MTKPLVIYHDNCADGFGAAFAAWLALGDSADYVAVRYGDGFEPSRLSTIATCEVYILDFSFPREEMDRLFSLAKRVVWLDHHKTAFEMWCPEFGVVPSFIDVAYGEAGRHHIHLDNNKSGAVLAWEYFHTNVVTPLLIRHIDDYDRWQFKIAGTKELNKALWSYAPWSFEQWDANFRRVTDQGENGWTQAYDQYVGEGAAILRAHDQNVQSVVKGSARGCCIQTGLWGPGDRPGLAANCPPHLTSDVGHELANQSGTFGLCWTLNQTKPVANCSLRSTGDYDVSAIAKAFGGGGHKNAAGFEVPIATLLEWLV